MGYEVFKYLDGSDPRLPFVSYTGLSTDPHNHLVVLHAVDKSPEGIWENLRVCVNL